MDHRPECSGWVEGQFQQAIAASPGLRADNGLLKL
jgi:hypothetical protein